MQGVLLAMDEVADARQRMKMYVVLAGQRVHRKMVVNCEMTKRWMREHGYHISERER